MKCNFTECALPYAEKLKWPVLPLAPAEKLPAIAKRNGGNGVYDATTDTDQIREWGRLYPNANIGIACDEVSGIVVVDVDPRNGGDATLASLAGRGYVLPVSPKQRTGNGGWHFILRWEPGITGSAGKLGAGIEIKSTGGYIVAAPSRIRKSDQGPGGAYEWLVSPFNTPVPRVPLWLKSMLAPPSRPKIDLKPIGGGNSNIDPLLRTVAGAPESNRNKTLYWATNRVVEQNVATSSNIARLAAAAQNAGLPYGEAMKTINSAINRAITEGGAP